jgi:hypothetical protein
VEGVPEDRAVTASRARGRAGMTWWRLCAAIGSLPLLGAAPPTARHDIHTAHVRLVVEGPVIVARVRMFRDDLQKAIKAPVGDAPASRGAVAAYVLRNFTLTVSGARLTGEVLDGGADVEGDQPVWWVLAQWKASRPITSLGVRAELMFDTFRDQQNIVMVSRQPGDDRRGLYFQAGDRSEQVVKF